MRISFQSWGKETALQHIDGFSIRHLHWPLEPRERECTGLGVSCLKESFCLCSQFKTLCTSCLRVWTWMVSISWSWSWEGSVSSSQPISSPSLLKSYALTGIHHLIDYIITFLKFLPFSAQDQQPPAVSYGLSHVSPTLYRLLASLATPRSHCLVYIMVHRIGNTILNTSSSIACIVNDKQDKMSSNASTRHLSQELTHTLYAANQFIYKSVQL